MRNSRVVDVFAEDYAHEAFLRPLLLRLAGDENVDIDVRVISAKGGHPRVLQELALFRRSIEKDLLTTTPDLVVIASDSNCSPYSSAYKGLVTATGETLKNKTVIACPDPHIERWYMADPQSFQQVIGAHPKVGKKKCDRDRYKTILARAISDGGHPATLGGAEFGAELVAALDLYRAGKNEKTLKHFIDGTRKALRSLGHA